MANGINFRTWDYIMPNSSDQYGIVNRVFKIKFQTMIRILISFFTFFIISNNTFGQRIITNDMFEYHIDSTKSNIVDFEICKIWEISKEQISVNGEKLKVSSFTNEQFNLNEFQFFKIDFKSEIIDFYDLRTKVCKVFYFNSEQPNCYQ